MSLAQAVGTGPTIEIGGVTLNAKPRILRHYALLEAEIRQKRGNPFDSIREAKQALADMPELMESFVSQAFDSAMKWKSVSLEDIGEYIQSDWRGQCFAIWLAIKDSAPEDWTFDSFFPMFSDEYEDRIYQDGQEKAAEWLSSIERSIDQGGGEDEMGN